MARKKNILKWSDEELLLRNKSSKNSAYFGELYNRYIPILYGVALKYLHNTVVAQNAVMQLFELLLPEISNYEIKEFRPWIYFAMKNHCLQMLRKENPAIVVDPDLEEGEPDEIVQLFNDEEPDNGRKQILMQYLKKLPVEQRIAIIRFFTEEMSMLDIADSTGYNLNQIKNFIQSGKRNLHDYMENGNQ